MNAEHLFQGLGEEGLMILAMVRDETGLPVVTEVLDVRLVGQVASYGTRESAVAVSRCLFT